MPCTRTWKRPDEKFPSTRAFSQDRTAFSCQEGQSCLVSHKQPINQLRKWSSCGLCSANIHWPCCTLDHPAFDPVNYFNLETALRFFRSEILL
jgi:hypothetical protein